MDSFFARMEPWRNAEGALHLYVLPPDDVVERVSTASARIGGIEHLPVMPEAYLHCTLQRLAQFDDEVSQAELTRLGDELGAVLSDVPAFDLEFARPLPGEVAVEARAAPSEGWDALVAACRRGIGRVWEAEAPSPPAGPHLSLAYATGPVPHDLVLSRLADVDPIGAMPVSSVHLVSVTVRPERGTFDFTSLATWDLSPHHR